MRPCILNLYILQVNVLIQCICMYDLRLEAEAEGSMQTRREEGRKTPTFSDSAKIPAC